MGVLNVTPDSFSDGARFVGVERAVTQVHALVEQGATVIDIGGESTRPGASAISAQEEIARVRPVLQALKEQRPAAFISIDTNKAVVARCALELGADVVNDVTALSDPDMAATVAAFGAGIVLMHMRGMPHTMQLGDLHYDDVTGEIAQFLEAVMDRALAAGVARERIFVDPGIGFGKTLEHNLVITRDLHRLAPLGRAIVYGPSRKRFLGEITGQPVEERDPATAAACVAACLAGAHVFRVHQPMAVRDALQVAHRIRYCVP